MQDQLETSRNAGTSFWDPVVVDYRTSYFCHMPNPLGFLYFNLEFLAFPPPTPVAAATCTSNLRAFN